MNFVSLFAGIGGIYLGFERAGLTCIAQVEIDEFCQSVLKKHWPDVPRFKDVREFGRHSIESRVDVVAGGFPCQDISSAGKKVGIDGKRSGLWSEFHRIICEFRPRYVVVENVAALLERGMGRVLGDLAGIGYDAEWSMLSACALGAPHSRERLFCIAHPNEIRFRPWRDRMPDAAGFNHWEATKGQWDWKVVCRWIRENCKGGDGGEAESATAGMDDGLSRRLDKVRKQRCGAYGNAVVPQVAEWIGRRLMMLSESEIK